MAPLPILLALMAALAAGIVRGFTGFGAGLLLVPSLTLIVGPALAVPTVVLMEIVAAAQLVPGAVRHVRWGLVLPLGLAGCLAIPLGSTVLASLDPDWTRRAISVVVLVFGALLWSGWRYTGRPGLWATATTGGVSGLLTGAAGVGGPPVILFFLSGRDEAPGVRASLICYFAITQIVAVGSFFAWGLIDRTILLGAAALTPVFFAGVLVGARLFGRVDDRVFRRATLVFLAVVAVAGLF